MPCCICCDVSAYKSCEGHWAGKNCCRWGKLGSVVIPDSKHAAVYLWDDPLVPPLAWPMRPFGNKRDWVCGALAAEPKPSRQQKVRAHCCPVTSNRGQQKSF